MSVTNAKINVGIVGATGYTGLELVKMLVNHPQFNLNYISNSEGGTTINALHPSLNGVCEDEVKKADVGDIAKNCELIFLALPHKTAMAYVKPLIGKGGYDDFMALKYSEVKQRLSYAYENKGCEKHG